MPGIIRLLLCNLTILFISSQNINSQYDARGADPRIVIMQETGELQDGLPVMELIPDTSELHGSVHRTIDQSFLDRFLELFRLCQCYLIGEGILQEPEPAYLALTDHQGGFAKQGFILQTPQRQIEKPETPYVDITVQAATRDIYGLMSVTQLFPHEMAHVIYRLLSPEDSLADNFRSVDMHYFSLITDYPTAFNEGFAEHMENVARHYEGNDSIRAGIREELDRIEQLSGKAIAGFTRDFKYPFRMGYYKAGMVNWYQKYEDYKRADHAVSGKVRYKNKSLSLKNPENGLTYRNAGVGVKDQVRNIVQFHSTEGAVSAFFTALTLGDHQQVAGSDTLFSTLCEYDLPDLDPLDYQFLKYFHVMHHYVMRDNSSTSQFSDFIRGYIESFPEEEQHVRGIYRELTGQEYTPELPASLWLMVTDHPHRLLVLDPFGAIQVPLYTFNLNAAEAEDLLTVRGLTREDADAVIRYRESHGFFDSLDNLRAVPGLSPGAAERLINLAFDPPEFEALMDGYQPELSISSLLIAPLLHVTMKAALYYVLVLLLILYLWRRREQLRAGRVIRGSIRYFFLWIGVVLLELAILFMFPGSWSLALLPLIFVFICSLLIYRRNMKKLIFTTYVLLLMFLLSLVSVV